MTDVFIKYNPYKEETIIEINKALVTSESPLSYVLNHRLQEWIEPRKNWKGIFKELREDTADRQVQIRFYGTSFDYEDLEYAQKKYGNVFENVIMTHVNAHSSKEADQVNKLEALKELYQELQNGPIEEFKADDIRAAFESAISADFEIVVVAPMSSGKSTLINAILGQDLLPAVNQATTAIITRIRDNDTYTQFLVTAKDHNGHAIKYLVDENGAFSEDENGNYIVSTNGKPIENIVATPKLISQLNYAMDPDDPNGKRSLVEETNIEGQINAIPSDKISAVFVDTPGGNNAQNLIHQDIMEAAIHDENKSLILYVFNGTQTGTYDSDAILGQIADEMKRSRNGKQSRDRFLFVANRMDDFDPEREDYDKYIKNTILPNLAKHGITEPQLFLVSAQLAKLIRMKRHQQPMTKQERSWLSGKGELFGDVSDGDTRYCLYKYSAISDKVKEIFDEKIKELSENNDDGWNMEIAEINSGVPALETAVRDYVDKYAVCIKINDAHEKFMRKVRERAMIDECEKKWASSKEELNRVQKEIEEKEKEREENKVLSSFMERIEAISFVEEEQKIWSYASSLHGELDKLADSLSKSHTIKKSSAETILAEFKHKTDNRLNEARNEVIALFNEGVLEKCNKVVSEYSEYVSSLKERGWLDLGGVEIKKLSGFKEFEVEDVEDMLSDEDYVFQKKVKVGERTYKKSGFFNAVRRFFGSSKGYETETIWDWVDMVKIDELIKDQIAVIINDFEGEIRVALGFTRESIKDVKQSANKKIKGFDHLIDEAFEAVKTMINNEELLKNRVKDNERNSRWIKDFVTRVDKILDI